MSETRHRWGEAEPIAPAIAPAMPSAARRTGAAPVPASPDPARELRKLRDELATLRNEFAQVRGRQDVWAANGLDDLDAGHGNQRYGAGNMRIGQDGVQIDGNIVGGRAGVYFTNGLVAIPSTALPRSQIQSYVTSGGAELDLRAYGAAGGLSEVVVNASSAQGQVWMATGSGATYTILTMYAEFGAWTFEGKFITLPRVAADPATWNVYGDGDGSLLYRYDLDKIRARINGVTENLATESYVASAVGLYLPLAGGTLTGALVAPIIYGSAAANGDITIEGTSDATKTTSYVILQPTSGNVGIGMTPANALDVKGSVGISSGNYLYLYKTGTNQDISFYNSSGNANVGQISVYPPTGTNVAPSFQVVPRGTGLNATTKSQFAIYQTDVVADTANYERLRIVAAGTYYQFVTEKGGTGTVRPIVFMGGNVGIGTTGPLSKLSINGGLHVGGDSDAGDNNILADGTITATGAMAASNLSGTNTGDQTLAGLGILGAYKDADQEVTSATLATDSELTVTLAATAKYQFTAYLYFLNDGATEGYKAAVTGTVGIQDLKAQVTIFDDTLNTIVGFARVTAIDTAVGAGLSSGANFAKIEGAIETTTAGSFALAFAQNAAGAGLGVHHEIGCSLQVVKVE